MAGKSRFSKISISIVLGFFVCGWMFFLGVLVGRGTAPVSFDTRSFQASLAEVADDSESQEKMFEKPVLDFYEVLKSPVLLTTVKVGDENEGGEDEIHPAGAGTSVETPGMTLMDQEDKNLQIRKKSLKNMTLKSKSVTFQNKEGVSTDVEKSSLKMDQKNLESNVETGEYTIQVAAYRDLADAVDEIDRLNAKGIFSYRTMGRVGTDIWHRVRIGSFKDMESAQERLSLLTRDGIKGMIIDKKE